MINTIEHVFGNENIARLDSSLEIRNSKSRNLCGRLPEGDGREAGDRCSILCQLAC